MVEQSAETGFELPVRVYIEDTDAGGIVFHAKYLHYMERARTEWVRSCGIGLRAGLAENISYVVQRLSIHYSVAAKLDDELLVTAEPVAAKCARSVLLRAARTWRNRPLRAAENLGWCVPWVWASCSDSALVAYVPDRAGDSSSGV